MRRRWLVLPILPLLLGLATPAAADDPPAVPPSAPAPAAPAAPAAAPPAAPPAPAGYAPPAYAPPGYPPGYAPPGYPPGYAPYPAWPAPQPYPYVPYAPSRPPMHATVLRSAPALGFGIALLVLGTLTASATASFLHTGPQVCTADGAGFACNTQGVDSGLIALTAIGIAGAVVGIPLIVYGAGRVPVSSTSEGAALPRWVGAPGANGWRWSF